MWYYDFNECHFVEEVVIESQSYFHKVAILLYLVRTNHSGVCCKKTSAKDKIILGCNAKDRKNS